MLSRTSKADDSAQQRVVTAVGGRGILAGEQFVEPVGGERQCDLRNADPDIHETGCRSSNHQTRDALDSSIKIVNPLRDDVRAGEVLPRLRHAEVGCRHLGWMVFQRRQALTVCFEGAGDSRAGPKIIRVANLTLTIADDLLLRARIRALEQDTSVNALVRDYLERFAGGSAADQGLRSFLERAAASNAGSGPEGRTWTRDELYDRR